ncbi:MAG: endonuclease NucS [Actinobacteria bacterium]|nr:endonuclease NucS [Actinomycetota bacterium]
MPVEMAIWRMTSVGPVAVAFRALDAEKRLEDMIVADPSLLGSDLLIVGRQVVTDYGGHVDVLGIDADGHLHVLELKRDRTPRQVVAQALDYGSWVQDLSLDQVRAIYAAHSDADFEEAFADHFGTPVPDVFNASQQLTVVASALDPASDRIITFLNEGYAVPINAVFFRHFSDGGNEYLARTWLLPQEQVEIRATPSSAGKVRPWNGRDFYCVLGNLQQGTERWDLGRRYGFVGAGGGSWYWKPLRNLSVGKRVFAYVGGAGYVGIGEVTGPMTPLSELVAEVDGSSVKVVAQPDIPGWLADRARSLDDEVMEYAVPVRWLVHRSVGQAVSERGLFASQLSACKLRDERTIEVVTASFGLGEEST